MRLSLLHNRESRKILGVYMFSSILVIITGISISTFLFETYITDLEILIFTLLLATVITPFIFAVVHRKIDFFEPIYLSAVLTFIYFLLVPFSLMKEADGFVFYGINYRPYLAKSTILALVALVGFYTGYIYGKKYFIKRIQVPELRSSLVRRVVFFGIVIATVMVCLWVITSGFPVWSLNIFDERAEYGTWYDLSNTNILYLYSARLAFIPLLLLLLAYRKHKKPSLIWFISYLAVAFLYLALGIRIAPITLFTATFVYYYLEQSKRPSSVKIIILIVCIFLLNGFLGYARTSRSEITNIWQDSWQTFLEGNSIVFGMSMIAFIYPTLIPFQRGNILLSDLVLPMPRIFWAEKPANVLIKMITSIVPVHYSPPIFGGWYADFGIIGPILIMFLIGFGAAYTYITWYKDPNNPWGRVLLSVSLASLLMIYTRVNAVAFNWILWVIVPVIIIRFIVTSISHKSRRMQSRWI